MTRHRIVRLPMSEGNDRGVEKRFPIDRLDIEYAEERCQSEHIEQSEESRGSLSRCSAAIQRSQKSLLRTARRERFEILLQSEATYGCPG